jgi:hypothetical protein
MPQESISVDVPPVPGQTGWILGAMAGRATRIRWEMVQGFMIDQAMGYRPGPLCQSVETDAVLIRPVADAMLTPEQLAERIASSPIGSLTRYIVLSRAIGLQSIFAAADAQPERRPKGGKDAGPAAAPASMKPVAQALATRYPTLSLPMREFIAVVVPHSRLLPDMAVLDDAIKADPDPAMRAIALCTRVVDPADEFLKNAKTADDPSIQQVAAAVEARLGTAAKLFARLSPEDLNQGAAKQGAIK